MRARTASVTPVLLLAATMGAAASLDAQDLNAAYQVRTGDLVANDLSQFLKLPPVGKANAEVPLVMYDPTAGTIDVSLYVQSAVLGSKTDAARRLMGEYWSFIEQSFVPHVQRRFGLSLSAQHFRIVTYERGTGTPILYFTNGNYVMP